jgi:hypothetical protein
MLAYWLWPEAPGGWDELVAAAKKRREAQDAWTREVADARQQARSERDQEWWDALSGVPGVEATPEAWKRWQMALQEQARREAFEEAAKAPAPDYNHAAEEFGKLVMEQDGMRCREDFGDVSEKVGLIAGLFKAAVVGVWYRQQQTIRALSKVER